MSRQTPPQLFHHVALAAALALSAVACAKDVPTGAQPCPCASGYVCCESGICAQGQDSCGEATSALSAQAVGSWTGYVENFMGLPSGADTLTISFTVAADGTLQGTAKLGDAAAPAPPTDPKVPWPPAIAKDGVYVRTNMPIEGFAYTAHTLKWEARRLKFDVYFQEAWKAWCELQTSHDAGYLAPLPDGGASSTEAWTCGPGGVWGTEANDETICDLYSGSGGSVVARGTDPAVQAACTVFTMCQTSGMPCVCDSTGCTAGTPKDAPEGAGPSEMATFDIALMGDTGDGSLSIGGGTSSNVRLVRASH